jgi:hypothetical protein
MYYYIHNLYIIFIYPNTRFVLYIVYVGLGFTFEQYTYNIYTLKNKYTFSLRLYT